MKDQQKNIDTERPFSKLFEDPLILNSYHPGNHPSVSIVSTLPETSKSHLKMQGLVQMIHILSVLLGLFPVAFAISFGEGNSIYRGERTTAT